MFIGVYELIAIRDANSCSTDLSSAMNFENLFEYSENIALSKTGAEVCEILQDTLTVSAGNGSVVWQESEDGVTWVDFEGVSLADSVIVLSEQNTGTTVLDYYYRVLFIAICDTQSLEVKYSVAPKTAAPLVDSLVYCLNEGAVPLTAVGMNLLWYDTPTSSTGVSIAPTPTTSLVNVTNYYVTQTLNSCESEKSVLKVVTEYCCDLNGRLVGNDTTVCTSDSVSYAVFVEGGTNLPYTVKYQFVHADGVEVDSVSINSSGIHQLAWFRKAGVVKLISIADGDCKLSKNDSVVISNYAVPKGEVFSSDSLCVGESAYLHLDFVQGVSPFDILIKKPSGQVLSFTGIDISDSLLLIDSVGLYELISVVDSKGCMSDAVSTFDFVNLFDYPLAEILAVDSLSYCEGNTLTLEAALVVGGIYQWYKDGIKLNHANTKDLINVSKGEYFVELSKNGCATKSDSVLVLEIINVVPDVSIAASRDTICPFEDVIYTVTDSVNSGESPVFEWYKSGVKMAEGNQISFDDLSKGDSVFVIMRADNLCQTADRVSSTVIYPHVLDTLVDLDLVAGNLAPCYNDKGVRLEVSHYNGVYEWLIVGDGQLVDTSGNVAIVNVGQGNSDITVSVTGECNTLDRLLALRPHRKPELELFENMELCMNDRDTLYVIDHANQISNVHWYIDGQKFKVDKKHIVQNVDQQGEYYVIGSNAYCADTSNKVFVKFINPQIELTADPDVLELGQETKLFVKTNVDSLYWYSQDLSIEMPVNSVKQFESSPTETVLYEVTGHLGKCEVNDSVWVRVIKPFEVPYFFSPNDDGDNDQWMIINLDAYDRYSIYIYNRWGNLVKKYVNTYVPWTGENEKKEKLPDGTYFYVIEANYLDKVISITGHVTIIK